MLTVSCIVVTSVMCLSWTSPSHASCQGQIIGLHAEVIGLRAEVNQMSATLGQVCDALDKIIADVECPRENFTRFESSCYYFSEPLTVHGNNWAFARAMCWLKGSDLVSIESDKEAEFLKNNTVSGWYWTSAHKHEKVFVWETTGANVANAGFSPWEPGQPDTVSYECAVLQGSDGTLYDIPCATIGYRYICETRL